MKEEIKLTGETSPPAFGILL